MKSDDEVPQKVVEISQSCVSPRREVKTTTQLIVALRDREAGLRISSSANERANQKAQSLSGRVSREEIIELGNFTIRGQLDEVRQCLNRNRDLVYAQDDIKDLSNRVFPQITGFQYAVWSGDTELWNIFLEFLPEVEAYNQFMALIKERSDIKQKHGDPLNFFDALINAHQRFKENPTEECWQKEIGEAYYNMPAWYIHMFSEEGEDKAWPTKQITRQFTRNVKYLKRWFTSEHNGGKCGSTFAWLRGPWGGSGSWRAMVHTQERNAGLPWHDLENSVALKSECVKKLEVLTEHLCLAVKTASELNIHAPGNRK